MQIHSLPAGGAYEQYLNIVSLLAAVKKAALESKSQTRVSISDSNHQYVAESHWMLEG